MSKGLSRRAAVRAMRAARFHDENEDKELESVDIEDEPPLPDGPEPDPITDAVEHANRAARIQHLKREVIMTIGLVPFPFTAAPFSKGWIGWLVFVNGVLCHGSSAILTPTRPRFVFWCSWWDIGWNLLLCVYVNGFAAWQPYTAALTVTAAIIWISNGGWQGVKSPVVHVVGVQWILCALLFVYEYQK